MRPTIGIYPEVNFFSRFNQNVNTTHNILDIQKGVAYNMITKLFRIFKLFGFIYNRTNIVLLCYVMCIMHNTRAVV